MPCPDPSIHCAGLNYPHCSNTFVSDRMGPKKRSFWYFMRLNELNKPNVEQSECQATTDDDLTNSALRSLPSPPNGRLISTAFPKKHPASNFRSSLRNLAATSQALYSFLERHCPRPNDPTSTWQTLKGRNSRPRRSASFAAPARFAKTPSIRCGHLRDG